jgi:chromosome segregation ATPase
MVMGGLFSRRNKLQHKPLEELPTQTNNAKSEVKVSDGDELATLNQKLATLRQEWSKEDVFREEKAQEVPDLVEETVSTPQVLQEPPKLSHWNNRLKAVEEKLVSLGPTRSKPSTREAELEEAIEQLKRKLEDYNT